MLPASLLMLNSHDISKKYILKRGVWLTKRWKSAKETQKSNNNRDEIQYKWSYNKMTVGKLRPLTFERL